MDENDFIRLEAELSKALAAFDRPSVEEICREIVSKIIGGPSEFPLKRSKTLLLQLRRKRMFASMLLLAEAIITSGQTHPQIKRQYAQGLIDSGLLSAAEVVIKTILEDPDISKAEKLEAIGLSGRIYKQKFVTVTAIENELKPKYMKFALDRYLEGGRLDAESYWHTINAVALLKRAGRDGIPLEDVPDPVELANSVERLLRTKEEDSPEPPKAWELATMLETQIALGRYDLALSAALDYGSSQDADAFEIGSTLRQLVEIWQLNDTEPPGDEILPVLRSALLAREGGAVVLNPSKASSERLSLESKFGDNASKTIKWYKQGLERTGSIARIELADGRGIGTAGLVDGKDFFPDIEGPLLITNSHVVTNNPGDTGLPAERVRANMQGIGEVFEIEKVVWASPQRDLDASFLQIKGVPAAETLPIAKTAVTMADPAPRVYVIGHPNGRDLEISLNDNRMVGANDKFLHYRTPTEPGSSGSPVFDQYGWEMIGLHHGGSDQLPRIDDIPGTYQANEGISITAIKSAILKK